MNASERRAVAEDIAARIFDNRSRGKASRNVEAHISEGELSSIIVGALNLAAKIEAEPEAYVVRPAHFARNERGGLYHVPALIVRRGSTSDPGEPVEVAR